MTEKRIVFIVGPTAVGKTDISLRLAEQLKGEIISCDSMQVYKEASVVSSKPAADQLRRVKHHLIDVVSVKENFDVAVFNRRASALIRQIHRRGKIPVIVGGSGLYVAILLDGIFKGSGPAQKIRDELAQQLKQHGAEFLYAQLEKVDPQAAAKIHPNNSRRIIRALEVYSLRGEPLSKLQKKRQGLWGKYNISILGLNMERGQLYERINARVEQMFKDGAVEEIGRLQKMPLSKTAAQIIGLKEIGGFLSGEYDVEQAKYLMKRNTRHFAKRQLTWFRRDKRIQWVEIQKGDTALKVTKKLLTILKDGKNG